ncbi:MAG: tRNA dihydrouridine synthase DusB [Acidobacteriota bacterium]|nr:tRNA dihydrouridine synthase DusB [Acidobacteriota bacterium]
MIFNQISIRNVAIRPAHILAPMAGITDTVFRRFIKRLGGCGLIMTEFVSSEGMLRHNLKSQRFLYYTEEERPITAQIFGADPDHLAEAARQIEDLGFDIIDLNLGCPAKKVVKCGGSGLLRDLPLLEIIFRKIRAAVSIPFTVKIRSGWSDEEIVAVPVARLAEACGVEAIAVHPRTRAQGYSGRARWDIIASVKASVRIPVIGNGDVMSPADAAALRRETNCDAVMIGRAAPTNPWIFRQMMQYFQTGTYAEPSDADRYELIHSYYAMLVNEEIPGAIGKMKQFASWFTHGVRNGADLRRQVQSAESAKDVLDRVDRFFSVLLALPGSQPAPAAFALQSFISLCDTRKA